MPYEAGSRDFHPWPPSPGLGQQGAV